MKLKFREANINDLDAINKIAWQMHELHVGWRPDLYRSHDIVVSEAYLTDLFNVGLVFVGESDLHVLCYAICFIREITIPILVQRKVMFIDAFGVTEEYRRSGIGKQFLDYIKNYALDNKCSQIDLQVMSCNKQARAFYLDCGMQEKALIMELPLNKDN